MLEKIWIIILAGLILGLSIVDIIQNKDTLITIPTLHFHLLTILAGICIMQILAFLIILLILWLTEHKIEF